MSNVISIRETDMQQNSFETYQVQRNTVFDNESFKAAAREAPSETE